jgi:hypothetical protein
MISVASGPMSLTSRRSGSRAALIAGSADVVLTDFAVFLILVAIDRFGFVAVSLLSSFGNMSDFLGRPRFFGGSDDII